MSKFNEYARKANAYAKEVFKEITEIENRYREAEAKYNANRRPQRGAWNTDAQTIAKYARIEADYVEAKDAYEKYMRYTKEDKIKGFNAIRAELEKATAEAFAANPEHIDAATLELLKSGILSADEYHRLANNAEADANPTMLRIIAKYAGDRAEQSNDFDEARAFRFVAARGQGVTGDAYLKGFDNLSYCFERCMNNTAMIDKWDELTGAAIERF